MSMNGHPQFIKAKWYVGKWWKTFLLHYALSILQFLQLLFPQLESLLGSNLWAALSTIAFTSGFPNHFPTLETFFCSHDNWGLR